MGSALSNLFIPPRELAHTGNGFFQLLCLGGAYSYVLMIGGTLIKDGSELLLLIPSLAGLVGAIILPVLGAVPDGAIVLFSGLGNATHAQQQLKVGIGALSGSTVMMLTVLWALSMFAGRVDFDDRGNGAYKKPEDAPKGWSKHSKPFFETGVNVSPAIRHAATVMVVTMIPLFVVQIPACIAKCSLTDEKSDCKTPRAAALAAAIVCLLLFFGYLIDQWWRSTTDLVQQQRILRAKEKSLAAKIMTARAMFNLDDVPAHVVGGGGGGGNTHHTTANVVRSPPAAGAAATEPSEPLLKPSPQRKFEHFVRRLFWRIDKNHSGHIEKVDLIELLRELGEPTTPESVDRYMQESDLDRDGKISFKDFLSVMMQAKKEHDEEQHEERERQKKSAAHSGDGGGMKVVVGQIQDASHHQKHDSDSPSLAQNASFELRHPSSPPAATPSSDHDDANNKNNNNNNSNKEKKKSNTAAPPAPLVAVTSPTPKNNTGVTSPQKVTKRQLSASIRPEHVGIGSGAGSDSAALGGSYSLVHSSSTTYGGVDFVPKKVHPDAKSSSSSSSSDSDVEMPDDLAKLPPEEQRKRVLIRSAWMLLVGTALVIIFSDPMVQILHELGERSGISPFYVAFVIAPLVSSSPEIIASYSYAAKKTITSASISFATLLGTVCMNNTFCLAIFLLLVVLRDLKWIFTAEVASMVFCEVVVLIMCVYNGASYRSTWILFAAALMPASLGVVVAMEAAGLD